MPRPLATKLPLASRRDVAGTLPLWKPLSHILRSSVREFSCHVFQVQQPVSPYFLCGNSPDLGTPIAYLCFRRHPAEVHPKLLDLLKLLRQMRSSCRQGFHQPAVCCSEFSTNWYPELVCACCASSAVVAQCLCTDQVGAFQNFLLCACPSVA